MPQPTRSAGPCLWLSLLLLLAGTIQANTEKAIFLGPEAVDLPSTHPGLADLRVDTLTPANWALRTHLEARFQDAAENPAGKASWFILDDLSPGQRYELRICWAATVSITAAPLLRLMPVTRLTIPATHGVSSEYLRAGEGPRHP